MALKPEPDKHAIRWPDPVKFRRLAMDAIHNHLKPHAPDLAQALTDALFTLNDGSGRTPRLLTPVPPKGHGVNSPKIHSTQWLLAALASYRQQNGMTGDAAREEVARAVGVVSAAAVKKWQQAAAREVRKAEADTNYFVSDPVVYVRELLELEHEDGEHDMEELWRRWLAEQAEIYKSTKRETRRPPGKK